MDGTRSRHYACYWHKAGIKTREVKGHQKCPLPIIPPELLEWQVFYVELFKQLGLDPDQHYKPLLNGENGRDGKIREVERETDEIEFAKFLSKADAFKAVIHKIMNLSFFGKQRLLQGVLDGPITVGHSTLIPPHESETEDEIMKILDGCGMAVRHNPPLLLELLNEEHTTKSL